MADNNQTGPFLQEIQGSSNALSFKEILYLCLCKWHWFVISVLLSVGIAVFYILCTPPVYTRSASLLIKENSKGNSVSSDMSSMFADLGMAASNSNVNNELITICSPAVMLEVVKRLGLNVDYAADGLFHDETLYGTSLPVKACFDGLADNVDLSFRLYLLPEGKLELDRLECSDERAVLPETVKGRLNDTLAVAGCKVVFTPTPHYLEEALYAPMRVSYTDLHHATDACIARFSASLSSEDATVIDLSYQDVSIQRAEDVLNTLIAVYNENWVKDKNQITVSTSQFITNRLGALERELGDVDEDISSYKSDHLLPDVETASRLYMSQSQESKKEVLLLSTQLSMARYVRNYLTANAGKNQLLPANSGLDSPGIEQQIADYNSKQLQRNNLVSNSSEQNPLVIDLDQSLAEMRNALAASIDNLMASLDTRIASLRRNEQHTTEQIAASPMQSKYLVAVGRQQKVKEELYLFLLQKREENELSQAFTAYNSRIITPPVGNSIPVAPKCRNILMIALIIGLSIPVAVILVRENMDSTVRGRKDVEKLSLPFVGEIPLYIRKEGRPGIADRLMRLLGKKPGYGSRQFVVVDAGKRDAMNEAFRVLRTNLEFMAAKDSRSNVILLTSFNIGSGKTFLTLNMAASFAVKGKEVLVIDGDLRKASASAFVHSPKQGLSNYLAGEVDQLQGLVVPVSGCPGFYILPVGSIPPNPAELLYEERFKQVVAGMRSRYDYVFVDCPPVDIVADTQIIEQQVDRTIFVVRAGLMERSMLPELERIYADKKYKKMSLILNGTGSGGYGYSSRYGYKYGYHYGYGRKS